MSGTDQTHVLRAGLLEACEDSRLFGIELTPRQRVLLAEVEAAGLLHVWALGRRSGKTLLAALVALWTCLLRPELREHVRRRERLYAVAAATNLRQARIFVDQARSIVEASPLLAALIESVSDDDIRFRNGSALAAFPCTSRGGRGWPVACLLLDEAAHQLDTDGNQAAEPVYRALVPSTAQFGEAGRVIVASSPFGIDGFFSDLWHMVKKGDLPDAVCAQASTLEMRPSFATPALALEQQRDPEGYRAEYLAEFVAAGGAFLDAARIEAAVADRGELGPADVAEPVAAVDLAFQSDSSALAIVGRDVQDKNLLRLACLRSWSPKPGQPLSFTAVLDEIAELALGYGVNRLVTDQFNAASASEHLRRRGLNVRVIPTTAQSKSAMFVDLKQRIYERQIELFPHDLLLAELRRLETATTPGVATVRIRRLGSSHGDAATALALAAHQIRGRAGLPHGIFWAKGSLDEIGRYAGHPRAREAALGMVKFSNGGQGYDDFGRWVG